MSIIYSVNFDIAPLVANDSMLVREATVEQKTAVLDILDPTMDEAFTSPSKAVTLANYLKSVLSEFETAVFTVAKEQHDAVHKTLKDSQVKHLIKIH